MKRIRETLISGLCLALLSCYAGSAKAEENLAVGGGNAVAHLNFSISIPTILYLQVGTASSAIDTVTFTVNNVPGTGPVPGASTSAYPVPVRVAALVGAAANVALTADSSLPLSDGSGHTIPFSEISCSASGDFASYTFAGASGQLLNTFSGFGNRTGFYTFSYANANYYPAGTYSRTVTYTVASL